MTGLNNDKSNYQNTVEMYQRLHENVEICYGECRDLKDVIDAKAKHILDHVETAQSKLNILQGLCEHKVRVIKNYDSIMGITSPILMETYADLTQISNALQILYIVKESNTARFIFELDTQALISECNSYAEKRVDKMDIGNLTGKLNRLNDKKEDLESKFPNSPFKIEIEEVYNKLLEILDNRVFYNSTPFEITRQTLRECETFAKLPADKRNGSRLTEKLNELNKEKEYFRSNFPVSSFNTETEKELYITKLEGSYSVRLEEVSDINNELDDMYNRLLDLR